uniref:Uncharacterized protein n=1 Tax=Rhizophora mucronata TaxID=61149 RepID=A0A2P2JJE9_RHIMU
MPSHPQDLKDGGAVPSSSILKLAMKSIILHPIIGMLMDLEKNISSSIPSFKTGFEV